MIQKSQEVANIANQEQIKEKQSALQKIQIAVGILVSVFGVASTLSSTVFGVVNTRISSELSKEIEEVKRNQAFAEQISKSLNNLGSNNSTLSKMTFVSLYVTAKSPENKEALLNLATASSDPELIKLANQILLTTPQPYTEKQIEERPNLKAVQVRAETKLNEKEYKNATTTKEVNKIDKPIQVAETSILKTLTPVSAKGWIYIGSINPTTNLLVGSNVGSQKLPKLNTEVNLTSAVNLRDGKPTISNKKLVLGKIKGIVSERSTIKIEKRVEVNPPSGNTMIWAEITVTKKII